MNTTKRIHLFKINNVLLKLPLIRFNDVFDDGIPSSDRAKQTKQFHLLYDFIDYSKNKQYSYICHEILYEPKK